MINWKKIIISVGISMLGIILYLTTLYFGITILLPFLIITHIILSIVFVKKNYKQKYSYILIAVFLIYLSIMLIPFPTCYICDFQEGWKYPQIEQSCKCIGIDKIELKLDYNSQCIGVRTNCNKFDYRNSKQSNSNPPIKVPINCN